MIFSKKCSLHLARKSGLEVSAYVGVPLAGNLLRAFYSKKVSLHLTDTGTI